MEVLSTPLSGGRERGILSDRMNMATTLVNFSLSPATNSMVSGHPLHKNDTLHSPSEVRVSVC